MLHLAIHFFCHQDITKSPCTPIQTEPRATLGSRLCPSPPLGWVKPVVLNLDSPLAQSGEFRKSCSLDPTFRNSDSDDLECSVGLSS